MHLAEYRERGVLRRLRASSVPLASLIGSQVAVGFVIALLGSVLLMAVAFPAYDVTSPHSPNGVVAAFLLVGAAFTSLGVLLGALLPTGRAAQAAGLLSWFAMMFLAGAGPPPEVLPDSMQTIGALTPLKHAIVTLQDPWNGFDWDPIAIAVLLGMIVLAAVGSVFAFRWNRST